MSAKTDVPPPFPRMGSFADAITTIVCPCGHVTTARSWLSAAASATAHGNICYVNRALLRKRGDAQPSTTA